MQVNNLLKVLPRDLSAEVFETLVGKEHVTIERIVSKGHCTPDDSWYCQAQNEWVVILQGAAKLLYQTESGNRVEIALSVGDYIDIPAYCKHKVLWTDEQVETVWLAVFY